jgi:hypothetical protein
MIMIGMRNDHTIDMRNTRILEEFENADTATGVDQNDLAVRSEQGCAPVSDIHDSDLNWLGWSRRGHQEATQPSK